MKILFYAHSSTLYGANRSLSELIAGLHKFYPKEFETHLILPSKGPIIKELQNNNISFTIIPHYNWIYFSQHGKRWEKSKFLYGLWKWKNKISKAFKNRLYLRKHIALGRTYDPDIVYINSSMNPMGLYIGDKLHKKTIWHHRETVEEPAYGYYLEDRNKFLNYLKKVNANIYISEYLKNQYEKNFGKNGGKVIYNYIESSDLKSKKYTDNQKIRFGIVGRINEQKGQKEIIRLFQNEEIKKLNVELHIFGHGDKKFVNWLNNHRNDHIFYHGFIDKLDIYEHFDYLIANSRNEAFGRVVIEANLNGIPVLARDSGAFPEIIEQFNAGRQFKDLKSLKGLIKSLSVGQNIQIQNFKPFFYENSIHQIRKLLTTL